MGDKFAFVFVDTSYLRAKKFTLESRRFKLFKKAVRASGDIQLALPSVIEGEIEHHMAILAKLTNDAHRAALEGAVKWPYLRANYPAKGNIVEKVLASMKADWAKFQEAFSEVCRLPAASADLDEVVGWYNTSQLPFEDREGKRNEFPDAIAISSLVKLPGSGRIAVVADDEGMLRSCERYKDRLEAFSTLDALTERLVQNQRKVGKVHKIVEKSYAPFLKPLQRAFEDLWFFMRDEDAEFEDAAVNEITDIEVDVLDMNDCEIGIAFSVQADVSAHATFPDPDSYYKDDDTRMHVSMGNLEGTVADMATLEGTCTLRIDLLKKKYEVDDLELDQNEFWFDKEDGHFTRDEEFEERD